MSKTDFITIGKIIAPHGVRGDVRIYPITDFPERFLDMDECYIEQKKYTITSARFHKQFVLMTFEGIKDRNAAELLVQKEMQVKRDELVPLPEGRYYIFDMIGLSVYDTENNLLGTLTEVLQPGSNDVYVVEPKDGKPLLLPAIKDVIVQVDIENKKMVVDPPEWEDE